MSLRHPTHPKAWETAGVIVGAAILFVNAYAVLFDNLSGPVFHPVMIFAGAILVYVCALLLGGMGRDRSEIDY